MLDRRVLVFNSFCLARVAYANPIGISAVFFLTLFLYVPHGFPQEFATVFGMLVAAFFPSTFTTTRHPSIIEAPSETVCPTGYRVLNSLRFNDKVASFGLARETLSSQREMPQKLTFIFSLVCDLCTHAFSSAVEEKNWSGECSYSGSFEWFPQVHRNRMEK